MTQALSKERLEQIIDAADVVLNALAGTSDEIHPEDSTKMVSAWDWLNDNMAPPAVVRQLASFVLAAHEQEPVGWTDEQELRDVETDGCGYLFKANPITPHADLRKVIKLYANPAPSIPDVREVVRQAHAEWSQATFGNVGPVGPLKHLAKEAIETAEKPSDLSEWADCQFLLWDAQRRAGITDEQIAKACTEKLEVNKSRTWPDPKDGEPRMHVKDDAPSIPAAVPDLSGVISELEKVHDWILNTLPVPTKSAVPNARRVRDVLTACRAALIAATPKVGAE